VVLTRRSLRRHAVPAAVRSVSPRVVGEATFLRNPSTNTRLCRYRVRQSLPPDPVRLLRQGPSQVGGSTG